MRNEIIKKAIDELESRKICNVIGAGLGDLFVKKELISQAIDAIESCKTGNGLVDGIRKREAALIALRDALNQPDTAQMATNVDCDLIGAGIC